MKRLTLAVALGMLTCGCATAAHDRGVEQSQSIDKLASCHADTLLEVQVCAQIASAAYLSEGQGARNRRTLIDLGILAANTYVEAASGLGAHPHSIFIGALAGHTIHSLDPIVNPGAPLSWSQAYAASACVSAFVSGATTQQLLADEAIVRNMAGQPHGEEAATVQASYVGLATRAKAQLLRIYADYLTSTTPALIDEKKVDEANAHPPSETTPPTTTDEGEIDPEKSIERLRNAIAVADTGIGTCVVAHAAAPPDEH